MDRNFPFSTLNVLLASLARQLARALLTFRRYKRQQFLGGCALLSWKAGKSMSLGLQVRKMKHSV